MAARRDPRGGPSAIRGHRRDPETPGTAGYLSAQPKCLLRACVADYLREEVAAEGLVRDLPVFSQFLGIASLSDTGQVNYSTIARECGVSSQAVKGYFEILEDTLLATCQPPHSRAGCGRAGCSDRRLWPGSTAMLHGCTSRVMLRVL